MSFHGSRRRLFAVIGLVAFAAIALAAWLGTSWLGTYRQARAFESDAAEFRAALATQDWSTVVDQLPSVLASSHDLEERTRQVQWRLLESVPFIGSSASAATELATSASALLSAAQPVLPFADRIVSGEIRRGDGSIDLSLIEEVSPYLDRLAAVVQREVQRLDAVDVAAVRPEIGGPLGDIREQLRDASAGVSMAAEVSRRLPGLLGAERDRSWLVILQNPAEARGSGGFPGGYVRISARDGVVSLDSTGKSDDLNSMAIPTESAPADSRLLWGQMLTQWRSFNLSPHFPLVGELAAASMKARGEPVDGVLAVDPTVVAAMLRVTGPVTVGETTLTSDNAERFFLVDMYAQVPDMHERTALSLALVSAVLKSFLSTSWDPVVLANALTTSIEQGRVRAWSANTDEEEWLATTAVGGVVPDTPGSVIAVAFNNASGNKMDAFVTPRVIYRPGRCESVDVQQSELAITVRNDAPENLPDSGDYGRADTPNTPEGSTRILVYAYMPVGAILRSSTLNGAELPLFAGQERGRPVWWNYITLDRGQESTLYIKFDEPSVMSVQPQLLPQGTAVPEELTITEMGSC